MKVRGLVSKLNGDSIVTVEVCNVHEGLENRVNIPWRESGWFLRNEEIAEMRVNTISIGNGKMTIYVW